MMAARHVTGLLLGALIITGCSGAGGDAAAPPLDTTVDTSKAAAAPAKLLAWGTSGTGNGELGQPLEITPVGVYYHKGDKAYGLPQNGLFVAVAVKVAATAGPDHVPPPGAGFMWEGDGETVTTAAGESPPWVGRVNTPLATKNIQPGRHQNYVITFDAFERGGTLTYQPPGGQPLQWEIPARPGGQGLSRVHAALDMIGVKR
jgi:hypothetical protein